MGQDDEWVADVKRWCLTQGSAPAQSASVRPLAPSMSLHEDIGYETAQPILQARHWPDVSPPY